MCHSGPLKGPGGELVPAGYPHFAHRRCLDADDRLGPDALASAQLQFTALADKLPACLHRDALRLASRIADSLPELRVQVSEMILEIDGAKLIAQWRMGIEEVIQSTKDDDLPARLAKLVGGCLTCRNLPNGWPRKRHRIGR